MIDLLSKERDMILLRLHHLANVHKHLEHAFAELQASIDDFNACRQRFADSGEAVPEKVTVISKINITDVQLSFGKTKSANFDSAGKGLKINI